METILSSSGLRARWLWKRDGDRIVAEGPGGEAVQLRILSLDEHRVLIETEGRRLTLHFARSNGRLFLQGHGWWRSFDVVEDGDAEELGPDERAPVVRAPMPGKVLEILAAVGDQVRDGQEVLRVEAMKMEVGLNAPFDGEVVEVNAQVDTIVDPEQALMTFRPTETE